MSPLPLCAQNVCFAVEEVSTSLSRRHIIVTTGNRPPHYKYLEGGKYRYHRSLKPMVSASHADGRGSTPGAGQILPPFSTHLTMFWSLESLSSTWYKKDDVTVTATMVVAVAPSSPQICQSMSGAMRGPVRQEGMCGSGRTGDSPREEKLPE
jgi:hypothetical protein